MKAAYAIPIFVGLFFISYSFYDSDAQLVSNQAFLIEGSGFAVTDKSIKISQIDLLMSTGNQVGSTTRVAIEDGFVTMDEIDFTVSDISGSILRDGRFLRLVGSAESSIGSEVTISLFGRLVQNSDEGSIYSFSGKITQGNEANKIIYTAKISTLGGSVLNSPITSNSGQVKDNEIIIRIAEGAAEPFNFDYTQQEYIQQKTFYTPNRVSTIPGATLTFVNEDTVSHSISSGKRDTNSRGGGTGGVSPYIPDGKINSGDILPGKRWSVTVEDIGFIALFDKDYPYMTLDVVVFPDIESDVIKKKGSTNPTN